jgi:pimeloyl-ACP methyl ester carboxylesterase
MTPRPSVRETPTTGTPTPGTPTPATPTDWPGCIVLGEGVPVVLLHSSLSSKSQWTALADRMSTRFRVIALDLWGYGDHAMPAARHSFTLDDEVRLVAAHLSGLVEPRTRVHLVGHSYGGLVALRFAQSRSERVASLSLYEPVAFRMLDDDDEALADARAIAESVQQLLETERPKHAAQAFVDFWSGLGGYASLSPTVRSGIARHIDKVPLDFQAAWRWKPGPDDLRAVTAPTLLITGNRSPAVGQRIVARLARALPNRYVASFDAGHMGPVTHPHLINPWIEAFVDRCAERDAVPPIARALFTPALWKSAAD